MIGADRNTPRLQATPATTTMRFKTDDPAVTRIRIPAGTRVGDAVGQVQFLTLATGYIEVGGTKFEVTAQAAEPGIYANGFAIKDIATLVDPIPGITALNNLSETDGGADVEGDTRYRARLALAFEGIGDGLSQERYVTDVLAWNARCVDVEVIRPEPGHVNIYPLMDTGAPNPEELASLSSIFGESNTHQGDFISAITPTAHDFSVDLSLTLSNPGVADATEDAVHAVLNTWSGTLGGYIPASELIRAARSIEGVIEADIPVLPLVEVSETSWRNCTGFTVTVVNV